MDRIARNQIGNHRSKCWQLPSLSLPVVVLLALIGGLIAGYAIVGWGL